MKKADMVLEPGWPCSGPLLRMADSIARKILPGWCSTFVLWDDKVIIIAYRVIGKRNRIITLVNDILQNKRGSLTVSNKFSL